LEEVFIRIDVLREENGARPRARLPAGGPGRRGRASRVAQYHQQLKTPSPQRSAGASDGRFNPQALKGRLAVGQPAHPLPS